jgi:uncharacterized membrane protein YecN with MAPEG domain
MPYIVPLYAAILALMFAGLSIRTLRLRSGFRIAIGDAGNRILQRASRVHANFAEYVPLSLILLYFVEWAGADVRILHAMGVSLVVARSLHAWGVSHVRENFRFRIAAMSLQLGVLISAALFLLYNYIRIQFL